jgi:NTE family protein
MIQAARKAFRTSPTGDYNLFPLLSLISGNRLRRIIDSAVVDSLGQHIDIEDLWKGYFCITSNYSAAREAVQTRGPLARSIRASVSIPGALPPVMLDGELHIDGGTFNNFPTDVMARRGAARIIGVDLLRERDHRYDMTDVPGPLELIRDRLRGSGRRYRLPSLTSLLLNTSMMYSYARQQESQSLVDLHFAPGVSKFGLLEWSQFDRIVDAGYRHAVAQLEKDGAAVIAPFRDT